MNILVADDDPVMRRLICDILNKNQFVPIEAQNGQEALDIFFGDSHIDIVILDVMMPVFDGWEVLKEIRLHSEVPVIMLTALGDETNEVNGFVKGADDYIAKPFSYNVFVARLNAIAKKRQKQNCADIEAGGIRILKSSRRVFIGDIEVALNPKEFELLLCLVVNKGVVLSREQILNQVWGYDYDGEIRTIDAHVKMLRAKLKEFGGCIRTIHGIGYTYEAVRNEDN